MLESNSHAYSPSLPEGSFFHTLYGLVCAVCIVVNGVRCSSATVMKYLRKRRKGFCSVAEFQNLKYQGLWWHSTVWWERGVEDAVFLKITGKQEGLGSRDPLYRQVPQCHVVLSQADDLTHGSLWGQSHHSNSNLAVDTGRLPCKIQYSSIEPFK